MVCVALLFVESVAAPDAVCALEEISYAVQAKYWNQNCIALPMLLGLVSKNKRILNVS